MFLKNSSQILCTFLTPIQMTGFLEAHTLVGLLPVPHRILCRRYQPSDHIGLWFTTFLWGVIYLNNQDPPLFDVSSLDSQHRNLITRDYVQNRQQ